MDWQATWDAPFADYLGAFRALIGDKRTAFTFAQTITGIIAAGSLVCSRIADDLTYNAHDLDDGLHSGLLTWDSIQKTELAAPSPSASVSPCPSAAAATRCCATKRCAK